MNHDSETSARNLTGNKSSAFYTEGDTEGMANILGSDSICHYEGKKRSYEYVSGSARFPKELIESPHLIPSDGLWGW